MPAPAEQSPSRDASADRQPWQIASGQLRPVAELDWLSGRREVALARLDTAGLPDTGHEDWRYTSLAGYTRRWNESLAATGQHPGAAGGSATEEPADLWSSPDVLSVHIIDGSLRAPPAGLPPGLSVHSLKNLPPEWRTRAADLLDKAAGGLHDTLVDLNTALLTDGILIATRPGASVEVPVHVRIHATTPQALSQPRLLVDLAPGSRLTLSLIHTGAGAALANAVTGIFIGPNGQLNLLRIQALPDDGMLTEAISIELSDSASVTVSSADLGSQLSRQSLTVLLAGTGADATVYGLFLADGERHIDNHTRLEHRAPSTTSREYFRGLADGHGHGVFNGKIVVQPGAPGSNAALTNRNLLLTSTAEIDTKPELEIYVDDVRCSHGATTGQLDASALFYLQSRGIAPATARQMLTVAFLQDSLAGVADPDLKKRLESHLHQRLRTGSGGDQ